MSKPEREIRVRVTDRVMGTGRGFVCGLRIGVKAELWVELGSHLSIHPDRGRYLG